MGPCVVDLRARQEHDAAVSASFSDYWDVCGCECVNVAQDGSFRDSELFGELGCGHLPVRLQRDERGKRALRAFHSLSPKKTKNAIYCC